MCLIDEKTYHNAIYYWSKNRFPFLFAKYYFFFISIDFGLKCDVFMRFTYVGSLRY